MVTRPVVLLLLVAAAAFGYWRGLAAAADWLERHAIS